MGEQEPVMDPSGEEEDSTSEPLPQDQAEREAFLIRGCALQVAAERMAGESLNVVEQEAVDDAERLIIDGEGDGSRESNRFVLDSLEKWETAYQEIMQGEKSVEITKGDYDKAQERVKELFYNPEIDKISDGVVKWLRRQIAEISLRIMTNKRRKK